MSDIILKDSDNSLLQTVDSNSNDSFSLERLSETLTLARDRAKSIHGLYNEKNELEERSESLKKELDKEKELNDLQSEFISLVSHEFKTPLAIIKASSDVLNLLLNKGGANPESIHKQLVKINSSVIRMNKLIESSLSLSRMEEGKMQFNKTSFCLEDLLQEVVKRHQESFPDMVFDLNIDTKKEIYNGDLMLMDQIFTNLIGNAVKYSGDNHSIAVSCKIAQGGLESSVGNFKMEDDSFSINSDKIKINDCKFDNVFEITIKDSGIGIDEEDLERLFNKFFRAKNTTGIAGTGIGLYLSKKLVELHKGTLSVSSKKDIGTKVTILLPFLPRVSN